MSRHSVEFHNGNDMKTNATIRKPSDLHYNPITTGGIVVARYRAKNFVEGIAKKHFSAIKDTTIIPHSRSPFDRAPFGWISDFPFCTAEKRNFVLVPSMKRLFPLLWMDFVEKYRWRGYRLFVCVSFLNEKVKVGQERERPSFYSCNVKTNRSRAYRAVYRANMKIFCIVERIIGYCRKCLSAKRNSTNDWDLAKNQYRGPPEASPRLTATNTKTSWYIWSLSHETHVLLLSRIGNVRSIWFLFRRKRIRASMEKLLDVSRDSCAQISFWRGFYRS